MAKEGIFISGDVKFQEIDKSKFQTVYIHESPTLAEIIKILNYQSVNLFAEHLVKQIAAEKTGVGNREKGIELITEFYKTKEILEDDFFMEDGSGLSHFNAISPDQITSILIYMAQKSKSGEVFLNSLPNAGSGTLSGFSTELFPENTLKAKSGSMTRVRCYAGYLKTDSGKNLCFSIMVNQFLGGQQKIGSEVKNLLLILKKTG